MEELFLKILNMSITAGWLVIAVVIFRFIMEKAPKWLTCIMWALVGIRLVCPFSFESMLSLVPSAETVPPDIVYSPAPTIHSGIAALNSTVNPIISEQFAPNVGDSANPLQIITFAASVIWIAGMAAMLVYCLISGLKIKKSVAASVETEKNIFICDGISSPFILGLFKPKIYLPSDIPDEEKEYVIAHEKAHIKRLDHFWKPLGFILLSVYWFNPLMWVAYVLLCRDIEFACDEKVIKEMDAEDIRLYSEALLNCSVPRKMITACPVAFGETGVKGRIKSVLSYKKPAFWIVILAVIVCIAVAIGFMTNPIEKKPVHENIDAINNSSSLEGLSLEITDAEFSGVSPYIEIKWINESGKDLIFGDAHTFYRMVNGELQDCNKSGSNIFFTVGYMLNSGKTFTKRYSISHQNMSEAGTYLFKSHCSENVGGNNTDYDVSIEFELKDGKVFANVQQFRVTDYVYDNGSFSLIGPDAENIEPFRLYNGMNLQKFNGFDWQEIGYMEEITLDSDNFDKRLRNTEIWHDGMSADKLKRENKRAWQVHAGHSENNALYVLLEQENGEFYLCYGYHGSEGLVDANYDSSLIRWIYRLEKVNPTFIDEAKRISHGWYISNAGYTTDSRIYTAAANSDKMKYSSVMHIPIYKLDSEEDLSRFKKDFENTFDFSHVSETMLSFDSTTQHIDFSEDSLFVIYVTADSLGYEYSVDSVTVNNGALVVSVISKVPETGDTAMTGYFITVQVNKKDIEGCTAFDAVLNNVFMNHIHLNNAVEAAIIEKKSKSITNGEYSCAAFEILQTETIDDESGDMKYKLYLLTCYASYTVKNDTLETTGSISEPAVITLVQNSDGTFTPLEYYVPIKGDLSQEAQKLQKLSAAYDGKGMSEICLMKAQKYFGITAEENNEVYFIDPQSPYAVTYVFSGSPDFASPSVTLDTKNHTATFHYSVFSSYYGFYTYQIQNNSLRLESNDDLDYHYVFTVKGDTLVFDERRSSDIPRYKYSSDGTPQSPVPDGAVFEKVKYS